MAGNHILLVSSLTKFNLYLNGARLYTAFLGTFGMSESSLFPDPSGHNDSRLIVDYPVPINVKEAFFSSVRLYPIAETSPLCFLPPP